LGPTWLGILCCCSGSCVPAIVRLLISADSNRQGDVCARQGVQDVLQPPLGDALREHTHVLAHPDWGAGACLDCTCLHDFMG
jgi:hypothetical protein